MKIAYIALGSNLGDRASNLQEAIGKLEDTDLHIRRASPVYETEPRDVSGQPWFLNQVLEIETELLPRRLLARLLKVERDMGRRRASVKQARIIDLDILLYGNAIVRTPELEIPHPRMTERRFVLEPLAELNPELRHPLDRRPVRELLAQVMNQAVRRMRVE